LAALAAAEAEKLFETKGLTYLDKVKAKKDAENAAKKLYSGNLSVKKKIVQHFYSFN
jgi:hypothetical protein